MRTKINIALDADEIDELIFLLHGRMKSLSMEIAIIKKRYSDIFTQPIEISLLSAKRTLLREIATKLTEEKSRNSRNS